MAAMGSARAHERAARTHRAEQAGRSPAPARPRYLRFMANDWFSVNLLGLAILEGKGGMHMLQCMSPLV